MAIFRVTFGFAGDNTGWTESHILNQAGVQTPQAAFAFADVIAQLRVLFLGFPFAINGIRISTYSVDGVTRSKRAVQPFKRKYFNAGYDGTVGSSLPAVVALQAFCNAGVNAQGNQISNTKTVFLGAPPYQCLDFGGGGAGNGTVNGAQLGLAVNFNAWKTGLIENNYGWLGVVPIGGPLLITTITQKASGQLQFVVAGGALVDGTTYNIRVSQVNNGRSPCNGSFVATYTAATNTLTTKEIVAFNQMQTGGQVQPYNRVQTFIPYGDLAMQQQTIKHKRGRPFLSERGRAKNRIRG